jgi:hypothetical protein
VPQFELTPKALANFSRGFERSEKPWGSKLIAVVTLKGFANCRTLQGLLLFLIVNRGLSLRSNPGLKLANAFGVNSN